MDKGACCRVEPLDCNLQDPNGEKTETGKKRKGKKKEKNRTEYSKPPSDFHT